MASCQAVRAATRSHSSTVAPERWRSRTLRERLDELRSVPVNHGLPAPASSGWIAASLRARASYMPTRMRSAGCGAPAHGHVAVPAFVEAIADAARRSGTV